MFTMKIRKMLTENKEDKLTYERDLEMFTFKTKTGEPPGLIVGHVKDTLRSFGPRILEFYEHLKTGNVFVKFLLRDKEEVI